MSFMQRWSQRKRDHGDASPFDTASEETTAPPYRNGHTRLPRAKRTKRHRALRP